jgi:3-oxoacid CoA-transferase subunit B
MALTKTQMAQRIAQELRDGWYVNLGIGIPTLVANYIPEGISVNCKARTGSWAWVHFPLKGKRMPT